MTRRPQPQWPQATQESGYAMLLVFLMAAIIAIALYTELPRVAFEAQRNKEELLIERGEQYKRAIQLFVRKVGRYPATIEELESLNNLRFLRKRYIDPMTGKDKWRLIHVNGGVLTDSIIPKTKPGQPGQPGQDQQQANTNTFIGEGPVMGAGNDPSQQQINPALRRRASDDPSGGDAGSGWPIRPSRTPVRTAPPAIAATRRTRTPTKPRRRAPLERGCQIRRPAWLPGVFSSRACTSPARTPVSPATTRRWPINLMGLPAPCRTRYLVRASPEAFPAVRSPASRPAAVCMRRPPWASHPAWALARLPVLQASRVDSRASRVAFPASRLGFQASRLGFQASRVDFQASRVDSPPAAAC
jgi:type II secretory pathway pseudopilin PulG